MGTIPVFPKSESYKPDSARDVGRIEKRERAYLMKVSGEGEDAFFETEISVNLYRGETVHGKANVDGRLQSFSILRNEFKVAIANDDINKGDVLCITEYPLANRWVHFAAFKGPNKAGNIGTIDVNSVKDIDHTINELGFDYFETGSKLTAAYSTPSTTQEENFKNYHSYSEKPTAQNSALVMGVCTDPETVFKSIKESPWAKRMLEMTKNGTIKFSYGNKEFMVYEEVRVFGKVLLKDAIHQAMCGPYKDCSSYIGKPVIMLAERIYKNHLNNYNRRVSSYNKFKESFKNEAIANKNILFDERIIKFDELVWRIKSFLFEEYTKKTEMSIITTQDIDSALKKAIVKVCKDEIHRIESETGSYIFDKKSFFEDIKNEYHKQLGTE